MSKWREWVNEPWEVVMWALIGIPVAVLMGDACVTVYRGGEVDYLPWLLVLVLGLALGFRRRLAGMRVGRGGISFGEDDEDEDER
jgi:hypothetical protein